MRFIADFHIHSKYSRATSKDMDLDNLSKFAKFKGIDLLGTGDFTHHLWVEELKSKLTPFSNGIYQYKDIKYILTTEVSNIYSKGGKVRKIHNMIFAPSFEVVDKLISKLEDYGNLIVDGRPILKLDSEKFFSLVKEVDENCEIVPCHIWTPWFSLFGSNSGFDLIEECFGKFADEILALETGLSSDPAMNFRWSRLDKYSLISNSDARSPSKIAREANVFQGEIDYFWIRDALKNKDKKKFLFTIEFFPQEGKYHFDGHRNCNLRLSPQETRKLKGKCPKCGRAITVGVMHRVEELSDRPEGVIPQDAISFKHLIPLGEIIAQAKNVGVKTVSVQNEYNKMLQRADSELDILMELNFEDLKKITGDKIASSIVKIREEDVEILPGYDGEYGEVKFISIPDQEDKQITLF